MAIPHFKVKGGSKAKGASGRENFRYLCREGKYQKRNDLVEVTHHNYPAWAKENPQVFWEAADTYERANARIYTELEIALPRELSQAQQLKLIHDFAKQEIGDRHPYTLAYHCPKSLDGGLNPHAHIMMTERSLVDGIARDEKIFFKRANPQNPGKGGVAKDPDWNRKEKVAELRASWEKAVNLSLKRAGIDAVISMKSLKERGIDREPEPKLGAARTAMMRQGKENDTIRLVQSLRAVRNIEANLGGVQKEITATIKDLAREVVQKQNRSLSVPASEIKTAVRDKKMDIYKKLREVEQERFSLGLTRSFEGDIYPATNNSELQEKRNAAEKCYSKLLRELSSAKKYEKQLSLLSLEKIAIIKGQPLSKAESLCDLPEFMQKVRKAKAQILERSKSQQIQLRREIPPP